MAPKTAEGTGTPEVVESTPQTFQSIADGVVADLETAVEGGDNAESAPAPVSTPAATPEPAPAAPAAEGTPESAPATPEVAAAPAEEAPEGIEQPNQVFTDLANLSRDDVPEDLLPLYDRLSEAGKQQQADYTRKTQALAEQRKSVPTQADFEASVQAEVQRQLAAAQQFVPQQAPQQPIETPGVDPALEAALWSGVGEPIALEAALAADTPEMLATYMRQQAVVESRRAQIEAMQTVYMPQVNALQDTIFQAQVSQAESIMSELAAANPDLAAVPGGLDTAVRLVRDGYAANIEDGVDRARYLLLGPQVAADAARLGQQIGATRKADIDEKKQQFSVPSGATRPIQNGPQVKGKTFDEIAAAVVEDFEK